MYEVQKLYWRHICLCDHCRRDWCMQNYLHPVPETKTYKVMDQIIGGNHRMNMYAV